MSQYAGIAARRVFIDTSAYHALADARDANHLAARRIATRLVSERRRLFTTNFIVAEAHALLLSRLGRVIAQQFLVQMDLGATVIIRVSARDERRARAIIAQYDDKNLSLTDEMCFAVVERLRIGHAFTLDSDFEQYGFHVLQPIRR